MVELGKKRQENYRFFNKTKLFAEISAKGLELIAGK